MVRRILLAYVCIIAFSSVSEAMVEPDWHVDIGLSFLPGQTMEDVRVVYVHPDRPVNILFGYSQSISPGSGASGNCNWGTCSTIVNVSEFYMGVIKYFNLESNERLKPYVSSGVEMFSTSITAINNGTPPSGAGTSLLSTGIYFEGGAYYKFGKNWRVGAGMRMNTGAAKDDAVMGMAVHSDGGQLQFGLMVGYEW
jgi:hypothetical protein